MLPHDQTEILPLELVGLPPLQASMFQQSEMNEPSPWEPGSSEGHVLQIRPPREWDTLGSLARGISDELNDILSPIIAYTRMALEEEKTTLSMTHKLTQVLGAAHRGKRLLELLLSISREDRERARAAQRARGLLELLFSSGSEIRERERVPLDVGSTVQRAITHFGKSFPGTIKIREDIEDCTALADSAQISQLVESLCMNAAEALDNIGEIHISLSEIVMDEGSDLALSVSKLNPGLYVRLSVSYSGYKLGNPSIQHIHDTYFTQNNIEENGLGLWIAYKIVKRHEGLISVQRNAGNSTTINVLIPGLDKGDQSQMDEPQDSQNKRQLLLLVDDEEMVVNTMGMILQRQGYRVMTKTCPREALDELRSRPMEIDLIITDYLMPLMTGAELAREVLRVRPDLPIILVTGYSENMTEETAGGTGFRKVAVKPLARADLINLVREVIDDNERGSRAEMGGSGQ